jgi:DNA-binding LytR/AlgR family response regulator
LGEIEQTLSSDNTFVRAGKSIIINKKYVRRINSRQSSLQIVTASASYEVQVSTNALKMMKS